MNDNLDKILADLKEVKRLTDNMPSVEDLWLAVAVCALGETFIVLAVVALT